MSRRTIDTVERAFPNGMRISPTFGDLEIQDFCGQWHRVTGRVEAAYRVQAQQGARGLVGRAFRSDSERRSA